MLTITVEIWKRYFRQPRECKCNLKVRRWTVIRWTSRSTRIINRDYVSHLLNCTNAHNRSWLKVIVQGLSFYELESSSKSIEKSASNSNSDSISNKLVFSTTKLDHKASRSWIATANWGRSAWSVADLVANWWIWRILATNSIPA